MKTLPKDPDPAAGIVQGQVVFSLALSAALDLALCSVLGVWADGKLGTKPLWTLTGIVVGLATAGTVVFVMLRTVRAKQNNKGTRGNAPE